MKILLFNNNPVIDKLVTLSAHKTSDEVDVADSIDKIPQSTYDLLIIDDGLFYDGIIDEIKSKATYKESFYIFDRKSALKDNSVDVLKKPFLPTELIERFLDIKKKLLNYTEDETKDDEDMLFDDYEADMDNILDMDEVKELQGLLEETSEDLDEDEQKDEDLESMIQDALAELSDEDLDTVIDEDDFEEQKIAQDDEVKSTNNLIDKTDNTVALKKLLEVLSDKDVSAMLKGMKININITLGDTNE